MPIIRRIVDDEIALNNCDAVKYDQQLNLDYAVNLSHGFYGRHNELRQVYDYIHSPGLAYPLLINGSSGVGKSAMLGEIVNHLNAYKINGYSLNFIGCGDGVYNFEQLILSIVRQLYPYFTDEAKEKYPSLPDMYDIRSIGPVCNGTWFHELEASLIPGRYVIVIDGVDEIAHGLNDLGHYLSQQELANPYLPTPTSINNQFIKLRIIASAALKEMDSRELFQKLPFFKINLTLFNNKEKREFVEKQLRLVDRKLTVTQNKLSHDIMLRCEGTGLYLDIFSRYLTRLNSYEHISVLPETFQGMAKLILNQLENGGVHISRLVRLSLGIIMTSHRGVDTMSLNRILALDKDIVDTLMAESFHDFKIDIDRPELPPIILSKLISEFSEVFIRMLSTSVGELITIKNRGIENVIREWLLPEELNQAKELQLKFHKRAIKERNNLSVCELPSMLHLMTSPFDTDATIELAQIMSNLDIMARRIKLSTIGEIIEDYEHLAQRVEYLDKDYGSMASSIRRLAAMLPSFPTDLADPEMFKAWCANLPPNCWLNNKPSDFPRASYLKNVLLPYDIDSALVGRCELNPTKAIASIEDGSLLIRRSRDNEIIFKYPLLSESGCNHYIFEQDNSSNGYYLAVDVYIEHSSCHKTYIFNLRDFSKSYVFDGVSGFKFSKSGNVIWMADATTQIIRLELMDGVTTTIPIGVSHIYDATDTSLTVAEYCDPFKRREQRSLYIWIDHQAYYYFGINSGAYLSADGSILYDGNAQVKTKQIKEGVHITPYYAGYDVGGISNDGERMRIKLQDPERNRFQTCYSVGGMKDKILIPGAYIPCDFSISASFDGKQILFSSCYPEMTNPLVIYQYCSDGQWIRNNISLPWSTGWMLITSSAISPNGEYIAYTYYGNEGNGIDVMRLKDNRLVYSKSIPNVAVGITFTDDSRYVVSVDRNDDENKLPLQFHLFDMTNGSYKEFPVVTMAGREMINNSVSFSILPTNKHILYDGIILDISTGKPIMEQPLDLSTSKIIYSASRNVNKTLFYEDRLLTKSGFVITSSKELFEIFDVKTRKSVRASMNDKALAISPDGSSIIFKRPNHTIYITDLTLSWKSEIDENVPKNIMQVFFHPKFKAIYMITRDWCLYFCELSGKILSRALLTEFGQAMPTARGLAVIRHRGQLSLYTPDEDMLANIGQWEFDDEILSEMFRLKYFHKEL